MISNQNAAWIIPAKDMCQVCPEFVRSFSLSAEIQSAILSVTAMGVYEAHLNGQRVGDFILAPGCTVYRARHQYQSYDITQLLARDNTLCISAGPGWYSSQAFRGWLEDETVTAPGIWAVLTLRYRDGSTETILSDESWQVRESSIRFSDIYDGETQDARIENRPLKPSVRFPKSLDTLIPQEGEPVLEQNRIRPRRIFTTPAGETVLTPAYEVVETLSDTSRGAGGFGSTGKK